MNEQVKLYAMPILSNGRLAAPVETEKGYWMLFADYSRDIKALKARYHKRDMDAETFKTRVDALESLRRTDAKTQERMRERLDKYEDTDYRQKQTIKALKGERDMVVANAFQEGQRLMGAAHKACLQRDKAEAAVAEQTGTITRLRELVRDVWVYGPMGTASHSGCKCPGCLDWRE